MTPDELRALADCLDDPNAMQRTARRKAADYLRAQADAQPVAWRTYDGEGNYDYRAYELNEDYADEWNRRNPNHVGWVEPLYTRPAPAAPQTEPKRDWSTIDAAIREYLDNYELIGEDDSGADACYTPTERELYLIYDAINGLFADESFVAAISAPQAEPKRELTADESDVLDSALRSSVRVVARGVAEPKREPLSEATALIEWPESAKWKNRAAPEGIERSCMGEPKREPLSDERIAEIQRAAYERAAQECIETAAELRRCADGCTDGRYDWKADGADDCADAIRALGGEK